MRVPLEERFWAKVDASGDCWLWAGSCDTTGYGQFSFLGRGVRAHRTAYELLVGTIPKGLTLDHLCRVRRCVNPDHLEPVSAQENMLRGFSMGAMWARRSHCLKGHEYTTENTYNYGKRRECKTCHHERLSRMYRERWKTQRLERRMASQ